MPGPRWAAGLQAVYTIPVHYSLFYPPSQSLYGFPGFSSELPAPSGNVPGVLYFESISYMFQIPDKLFLSTPSY